jgi:DNA invertase Pin-like site-specific DNA recombinase
VSTEEQAISGLGLDAQRASLYGKAAQLGLPLTVCEEPAMCGAAALEDRPVLMQAVAALGRGDVLLVAKRDRLGRDFLEVGLIERLVKKRGARVVSAAGEGTADDEPSSVFTRHVMDAVAELEHAHIRARTKAGLTAKRARGERAGTIPFGFQLAADDPDHQRIEPAPVEQRLVAQFRALRAAGKTYAEIAAIVTAAGATTRRGTPWRFQYIAQMLKVRA